MASHSCGNGEKEINGALQRERLIFPSDDLEVEDRFTTHTYTLRDGKIICSKGNDHIIDAARASY